MSCDLTRQLILDHLAGGLAAGEEKRMREHLAGCARCVALAGEYRRLWQDLGDAAVLPEPGHGLDELARAARREGSSDPEPVDVDRSAKPAFAIAHWIQRAALAVVLVGAGILARPLVDALWEPPAAPAAEADQQVVDDRPIFVVLMYAAPIDDDGRDVLGDDINEWARGLFRQGIVLDGVEFGDASAWAGSDPSAAVASPRLTHTFRLRAVDLETARQVAATSPSVAVGGIVEVRPEGR